MDATTKTVWFCGYEGCGRSFSTKSAAYRHKYSIHYGRKFQCPDCDVLFAQKDSIKRHRLARHPPPEDHCGDTLDQPTPKRQRSSDSLSSASSTETIVDATTEMETGEDELPITGVSKLSLAEILRPPSPASPITRGYIRPPSHVPYKPSSCNYYIEDTVPRMIINREDDLPVPARLDLHPTDSQGTPKADFFRQSSYSYKTLAESIYRLEDQFYPKCCLRGDRTDLKDI